MKQNVLEFLKNSKDERISAIATIALETGKPFMEALNEYEIYSKNHASNYVIEDILVNRI